MICLCCPSKHLSLLTKYHCEDPMYKRLNDKIMDLELWFYFVTGLVVMYSQTHRPVWSL